MEDLVTLNVEELVAGVPWLQTMRSRSIPGHSSVVMIFEPGTDLMRARQMVQERLTLAYALPNASKPPVMIQPMSATSRVAMIGLSSKDVSLIDLSVLARWTIKPRLLGVPGVANVAVWGDRDRQLQVQIDPERLRARGVTQSQIIQTAGNALWISPLTFLEASFPGTGGWIDGPNQRLEIRHVLPLSTPQDLARVMVEGASTLRLGDVANVVEGHPPLIGDALLADGPGLLLVVEKLPGPTRWRWLGGGGGAGRARGPVFPAWSWISPCSGRPASSSWRSPTSPRRSMVAAVLVVLTARRLLYDWRAALISLVAIPLSLVTATALVGLLGATLNTMVLAGLVIALAVVVDDAILGVDAMLRRLRRRRETKTHESALGIAVETALEMRGPMLYATVILLLAVVPVFLMEGLAGAFFRPLALSFALALAGRHGGRVDRHAGARVRAAAQHAVGTARLAARRVAAARLRRGAGADAQCAAHRAGRAVVLVAAGLAVWPCLGQSLLPTFQERHLRIDWVGAPGTSHPAMARMMTLASREVRSIPGVGGAYVHVGRAVTGDQAVDVNASQLWVSIDPVADYDATVAAVQGAVDGLPGPRSHRAELPDRQDPRGPGGASQSIVVRVYGKRRDVLRRQSGGGAAGAWRTSTASWTCVWTGTSSSPR